MKNILLGGFAAMLLWTACTSDSADKKVLPIYGNREPVTKMVNGKQVTDTIYQTIPPFKFVNQYGDSISNKTLNGNIYVVDFFLPHALPSALSCTVIC